MLLLHFYSSLWFENTFPLSHTQTIETIGLLDVFETPGISLSKDLD